MSTPFTLRFPTALDDADSLGIASNDAGGALAAPGLGIGAASFAMASLSDANEFGASGPITIDDEIIYYESRSGVTFSGLTRAREGTSEAAHSTGAVVEQNITASYHNTISAAVRAIETKLGYDASTPPGGGASLISDNAGRSAWRELVAGDIPDLSASYQPLDADLTAIAALTTTAFGRSLLTQADAAAARTAIGAGTSSFDGAFASLSGKPTTLSGYGITDAANNGVVTGSGLTMATARLLGRTTASSGAVEEITVGAGLSLSGGSLTASGTSPGGSSGNLQFNNAGAFGGSTWAYSASANWTMTGTPAALKNALLLHELASTPTNGVDGAPVLLQLHTLGGLTDYYQLGYTNDDGQAIANFQSGNKLVFQFFDAAVGIGQAELHPGGTLGFVLSATYWGGVGEKSAEVYGLALSDSGLFSGAIWPLTYQAGGVTQSAPASALADGSVPVSHVHFYLDEAANELKAKWKESGGAVLTATLNGGGGGLTIGTTTITSGTNTKVLYNNAGVVGEYTITGTGNVAMSASPTFTGTLIAATISPTAFVSTPVSPSSLTADQNDYAGATGLINRFSTNSDSRFVSGMTPGTDGQVVIDLNVGSFDFTYQNSSGNSTAAYRFTTANGADLILRPNEWGLRVYDGTTQRWRVANLTQSKNTTWTGTWIQTSAEANAIVSGPNGTTNPVFRVINSTSSQADGVSITGLAAGAGTTIAAISGGANSFLTFTSKGTGINAFTSNSNGDLLRMGSNGTYYWNDGGSGPSLTLAGSPTRGSVYLSFQTRAGHPMLVTQSRGMFGWGSWDAVWAESADTGLVRFAAGVVRVNTGQTSGIANTAGGSFLIGASTDSLTGNFTVMSSNAATNSVADVARLGVNSTGTAAAGFGGRLSLSAETSTTNDQQAGSLGWLWTDATHASRTGAITFSTVSAAGSDTERLRVDHNGLTLAAVLFANLASTNGILSYCSDCAVTSGADNTCAGSGTGALAIRLNGTWRCFIAQN